MSWVHQVSGSSSLYVRGPLTSRILNGPSHFGAIFFVVICFEVTAVKPNHLSFPEEYESVFSSFNHSVSCKFMCCQSFFLVFREVFQSFFYNGVFGVFKG